MVKIGNVELGEFPLLLAPMEDVSDPPFRAICKEKGADVVYTEFIAAEGLIRGAKKSVQKLDIYDTEKPVGIQIFGGDITSMEKAIDVVDQANPDIIDINFGCPVKKITCKGAGAGILLDLPKMQDLTARMVKRTKRPVTVKTRLGWDEHTIKIEEVAQRIQDAGAQALTVHCRTRKQMYKGLADWSYLAKIKSNARIHIPIFGNGDIDSPEKAVAYKNKYGVDGIMIGRASIGYPWIFQEIKHFIKTGELLPRPTLIERLKTLKKYLHHAISWKGERLALLEARRHYSHYLKGLPHAKPFRLELVKAISYQEVEEILGKIAAREAL